MELGAESWDDDRVTSLLDTITQAARKRPGCGVMRLAMDGSKVARLVQQGVNMVLATHDAHLIKDMYRALFSQFRDAVGGVPRDRSVSGPAEPT
jgi:hypothetical protein